MKIALFTFIAAAAWLLALATIASATGWGDTRATPSTITTGCWTGPDHDGDTLFDLCDPDDDNDGLSDMYEAQHPCMDSLLADAASDPDIDAVSNSAEQTQLTDPCDADTDADGFRDAPATNHSAPNANILRDNCPADPNPTQLNTDGNHIDSSPPFADGVDDKTWANSDAAGDACDTDADNDGRSNADEASGAGCSGIATDPLLRDTDGDRVLDGPECAQSFNPIVAGSTPTGALCAAFLGVVLGTDTDGDKIKDYIEFCYYGSDRTLTDTDGDKALDGAKDGCEVASLNTDRIVSSGDQGMLAGGISGAFAYHPNIDLDKSGILNSGDQGLMASFIVPGGQCPG